jgi:hypothetical protein
MATVTELFEEDGEQRARLSIETARQDGQPVFTGTAAVANPARRATP